MSPFVERLKEHASAWVQRFGLIQDAADWERFLTAKYWVLIARAYPLAEFETLAIAHDWNCWGFMLDDLDDDGPNARRPEDMRKLFVSIMAILRSEPDASHSDPFLAALHDVWQRLSQHATPVWRGRFRGTLEAGLGSYVWEATNRARRIVPSLSEYMLMRRLTGGWLTDVALVDITEHFTLPSTVYHNPNVRQLLDAANNVICWANDLYSLAKERQRGDVHNLVMILQRERQLTLQEAIGKASALHDAEVRRYLELEQRLPSFGSEGDSCMQKYAAFARAFIRANMDWATESGRYHWAESIPLVEPGTKGGSKA
jgi:hypothetical protein